MNTQRKKAVARDQKPAVSVQLCCHQISSLQPIAYSLQPVSRGQRSGCASRSPLSAFSSSRAFTLIELLVVIVVIAILVSITLPLSKYAMRRASEARQEVMLAKIRGALDDYRAAYGEYPIAPPAPPADFNDVVRHYPTNFATYDAIYFNSYSTNINLSTSTVEIITNDAAPYKIDYCLTYPLMFRQLAKNARPFMEFPMATVGNLVTRKGAAAETNFNVPRRTKSGMKFKSVLGIFADPVQRSEAIDPVSGRQWKYECTDGLNYTLTTNGF